MTSDAPRREAGLANALGLPEDRILVEQEQLLLKHVGSAVIPAMLAAIALAWALSTESNAFALWIWAASIIVSKLANYAHARSHLAAGIPRTRARRLALTLMALNAVEGVLWGSVAWLTLDPSSIAGSAVTIGVVVGVGSNRISLLSPVLPVFVAFVLPGMAVVVAKIWALGDPAFDGLGFIGVLCAVAQLIQARNSARAALALITLRFENMELVNRLRVETETAQAARREAEEADASKSKFLAAASHDLRQPIHALGLFLELLAQAKLEPNEREALRCAQSVSEASAGMLDSLLDFSRIEAGAVAPQVMPFALEPLIAKIETEVAPLADAKDIALRVHGAAVTVRSDPVLVELVLRNLISNAVRYTNCGGVLIACRKRRQSVVVEVWDTGIGIAPDKQEEIFREFHQLGNPERDRRKGIGLGLAICRGLAQALGHELSLASKPGRGSVFRLVLPTADLPEDRPSDPPAAHRIMPATTVLVVEDDETVRIGMSRLLHSWGCDCRTADSIAEALTMASKHRPDLLICDYRLRDHRTGVEAITALRGELGQALPALLITGDTSVQVVSDAAIARARLLYKPVSPDTLRKAMAAALLDS